MRLRRASDASTARAKTASRLGPSACTEALAVARSAGYHAEYSPWTVMIVSLMVTVFQKEKFQLDQ